MGGRITRNTQKRSRDDQDEYLGVFADSAIGAERHDHNEGTLWHIPHQLIRYQNQQERKKGWDRKQENGTLE